MDIHPNILSRNQPLLRSCGLVRRLKHLQTELMSAFDHESNLLFSVPRFVEFCAFVDVLLAILEQPIKQTGELARHRCNGLRCAQPGPQTSVLRAQVALTPE